MKRGGSTREDRPGHATKLSMMNLEWSSATGNDS